MTVDLNSDGLPAPRLAPDANAIVWVDAYTDFKLHDIGGAEDVEPLDRNQSPGPPKFRDGNRRFRTKRLWGAANEAPFFHHGLFTTVRRSILAQAGEALTDYDRDSLIEFLKTPQVPPPGTKHRIVDENFKPREWPPALQTSGAGGRR